MTRKRLSWLSPNALYTLQVGPFVLAALIVGAFAIPAFVRFEPLAVEEEFGAPVILLSWLCLVVLGGGIYRACAAYARTKSVVRKWHEEATVVQDTRQCADGGVRATSSGGFPIYETGPEAPPLVVAGFWRPQLMVSSSTSGVLSEDELARAIAHESAHISHHDNLKKLSLRVLSFPRASEIERRWLAAVEMDADRQAVSNQREALDLASALVKASRLNMATAELTTNLTSEGASLLEIRVQRLLSWDESRNSNKVLRYAVIAAGILTAISTIVGYQGLLLHMHTLAELLMR